MVPKMRIYRARMAALDAHIVGLIMNKIETCIFMKVVVTIEIGTSHACLAAPLWDKHKLRAQ